MLQQDITLQAEEPACIRTSDQLRRAQDAMARLATQATAILDLDLHAANGCILAQDVELRESSGAKDVAVVLPSGSKIDWRLLPRLCASGHTVLKVRAPVRCGVVVMRGDQAVGTEADAAAAVVQAALQQMGLRTFKTELDAPFEQWTPATRMFAKYCDLILVIASPGSKPAGEDCLRLPKRCDQVDRPCLVLPADPHAALCNFVSFIVPLIRRLQGRTEALPRVHRAVDAVAAGLSSIDDAMVWVSANGDTSELRLHPRNPEPGLAAEMLTRVSGIAWKAEDFADYCGGAVAYLPFDEWLA